VDPAILAGLGLDTRSTHPNPVRNPLLLARLDHHPSPSQAMTLRYRLDRRTEENRSGGGNWASDSFFTSLTKNWDVAASHTWSPSSGRWVNDARVQFARQINDFDPVCTGCPFIIRPSVISGKPANFPQVFVEDRIQLLDTVSLAVPDMGGDHYFKAGADVSFVTIDGTVPQNFDGIFLFQTDAPFNAADQSTYPLIYQVSTGDPTVDLDNDIYAFFIQDQWRVTPRLTFNLGLRYDVESHNAVGDDKDNLGPRLHFAWDPNGKGKTVIRGGFGIYYDQVFLNVPLFSQLLSGAIDTRTQLFPGYPDPSVGGSGVVLPNPPPTIYRLPAGGNETPSTRTFSFGVKHELRRNLALSADLVHVRGRNLMLTLDRNYTVNGSPRPDPNFGSIFQIETVGRSNYKALQLGLEKRYSERYGFSLAYTLSDTKRNTEGHQFQPVDSRDFEAEYAPANNDARHTLAGNATFDLPARFKLGLTGRLRSGVPYNEITGTDDNADTNVNDRPPGVSRNPNRGDSNWTVDMRLARVFPAGRTTVEAVVEAFNVFNHPSRAFYEENLSSDNFGNPIQTLAGFRPRQVQVGLRLDF
jgi:hypothetical protein